jgi:uncharacterized alpha-E superfamily protein
MLSRVAHSLYWMSRYIERAENIARLLEVNLQMLVDFQGLDDNKATEHWSSILASSGDEELFEKHHQNANSRSVTEFFAFDLRNPSSILSCVYAARENARMIRDQISLEMWETINELYLFLKARNTADVWNAGPNEFFQHIKMVSHLFQGLTASTYSRNEGWEFLQFGKYLERADKTTRILDVKYHILLPRVEDVGGALDYYQWAALLKSVSSFETYRTIYRDQVRPINVAELLILDRRMPRSLAACLEQIDQALSRVQGQNDQPAKRLSAELQARLVHGDIEEIFQGGLHEYLTDFLDDIHELGQRIQRAYLGAL